jgi:hypothetical protein
MPIAMRKIIILPVVAVILIALAIGAYVFLRGSPEDSAPSTDSYFSITGLVDLQYFSGESVVVQVVVINNEPLTNESVPATAAAGDNTNNSNAAAVAPPANSSISHTVIAELSGGQNFRSARAGYVSLARNERSALVFDFGPVPAGSYIMAVGVSGDNVSTKTATVVVEPTPRINEWTSVGDVAFLLDNLGYDTIDVNIRNSGPHAVIFGDKQYNIFVNSSDDFGVMLQGLNETLVLAGETVIVHAKIPCIGSYYLDYFAIAVPGRSELVKIPWGVWITPAVL